MHDKAYASDIEAVNLYEWWVDVPLSPSVSFIQVSDSLQDINVGLSVSIRAIN